VENIGNYQCLTKDSWTPVHCDGHRRRAPRGLDPAGQAELIEAQMRSKIHPQIPPMTGFFFSA
jgi:hypothetical protein